ncbi:MULTISPECIES: putative bifunctional diguanylate cyclase/phosphodiesterase [Sphingomonas]|uniref:putative bifunctional diguanylate cyclase/phosphodiesterase n=1 Tax=Sphingomonas TaxID=13687 RepID=UPI0013B45B7D|nr:MULTISPECIES: EAL domain-containing protein [Sphingomonas]
MGTLRPFPSTVRTAPASSLPLGDVSAFASAKMKALGWALAAMVSLCLLVMLGSLAATHRESVAIATEREQQQVRNALIATVGDMRADLTSVTFWDEAAQHTGVKFDPKWTDENVGVWLAKYYSVDESFVLTDRGGLLASYLGPRRSAAASFDRYRPLVAPVVAQLRRQLHSYQPGQPDLAFGAAKLGTSHQRLDFARLVMVEDSPRVVIVAPILPDFGHVGPVRHPAMLVASFRLDGKLFRTIGRELMIDGLRVSRRAAPLPPRSNRLPIIIAGSAAPLDLRWTLQPVGTDLLRRSLPVVATLSLLMLVAGVGGARFVRDSARQLYRSRVQAMQDELTGLPNRRHLTRLVEEMTGKAAPFALLFVDLDRFKDVNDLWGHAAGDEVIREAAARLTAIAGAERVARFGGDEFVLVVAGGRDAAAATGQAVLAALRQPFAVAANMIVLAGSVGVAVFPDHGPAATDLMRKADLALYRAKELGKDRVIAFDDGMDGALRERQTLERDLRRAVAERELSVDFQPQFGRADEGLIGIEALARWRRADGRTIEPGTFVPLAEELGLIAAIDALVLEQACVEAVQWPELMLAVNVSPGQLHSPGYAEQVLATLERTGLPARRLRLEITETALFGHMGQVAQTVAELRSHGVHFAIDDFGTGFSSLDRLRMLKLDGMKIDRSFVADLVRNPDCPALISSMVALGHALGLTVTAEGVETDEQYALLQLAGCDEYQGNLLSLPVGATEVAALLDTRRRELLRA